MKKLTKKDIKRITYEAARMPKRTRQELAPDVHQIHKDVVQMSLNNTHDVRPKDLIYIRTEFAKDVLLFNATAMLLHQQHVTEDHRIACIELYQAYYLFIKVTYERSVREQQDYHKHIQSNKRGEVQ